MSNEQTRLMHWTAPMEWNDTGKPMLRFLGVPHMAKSESVYVVPNGVGYTLCGGDGNVLRSGLFNEAIKWFHNSGVDSFAEAVALAVPYVAPRSPVKGMVKPSTGGADIGGLIADALMPAVDARIAEALEGIEERLASATTVPAPVHVTVHIPALPPVTLTGSEHGRFIDLVKMVGELPTSMRNVLLWGERGSGKSTAASMLADKLGLEFGAVSFSAGASESLFTGRFLPGASGAFEWRPTPFTRLYTEGGVFCLDELDKADPQVATALNMALANGKIVTTEGKVLKRHDQFIAVGGANSLQFSKVNTASQPQDGSLLDRFGKIRWDLCPILLRNVVTGIAGSKGEQIIRVRKAVNDALLAKRYTDWDIGFRMAMRMAYAAHAGRCPVKNVLHDEVQAMAPQYVELVMAAAE